MAVLEALGVPWVGLGDCDAFGERILWDSVDSRRLEDGQVSTCPVLLRIGDLLSA